MNTVLEFPENQKVRLGDTIVIYISDYQMLTMKVEPNAQVQTKFGLVKTEDVLDKPYGLRVDIKRGWILPLRLTPELWTKLLPHRTQILYQADISMILLQLDIKPGSIVVESGTGSGSLSHAIIRATLPDGYLYTFDVNESRVNEARREFIDHGLGDRVKVTLRNVCEQGYGEDLADSADACILDLPQTWEAIEHAYKVLKPNGSRLCTFSPCIEQVKLNVAKMDKLKFKDIVTLECLSRPYDVKVQRLRVWTDEVLDGLLAIENKRYEYLNSSLDSSKRLKMDEDSEKLATQLITIHDSKNDGSLEYDNLESLNKSLNDPKSTFNANLLPKQSHLYAKQFSESVGHSGYLTFATKRM